MDMVFLLSKICVSHYALSFRLAQSKVKPAERLMHRADLVCQKMIQGVHDYFCSKDYKESLFASSYNATTRCVHSYFLGGYSG